MIPTGQQVCDMVRILLGDTEIPAGQIFKNQWLYDASSGGAIASAYTWLFINLRAISDKRIRRTQFGLINANINYINPKTLGISNLGSAIDIWERTPSTIGPNGNGSFPVTSVSITANSPGVDPLISLGVAHGGALTSGMTVDTYLFSGISDDINDSWTINVPDNNHINLMGCTATGNWTSGSGLVLTSQESWPPTPMVIVTDLNDLPGSPGSASGQVFGRWMWQNGVIRVPPVTSAREIRFTYLLSSTAPTDPSVSLGIDDCMNVLAYKAAAIAGQAKGIKTTDPAALHAQAAEHLEEFKRPTTKQLQRERFIPPRYRQKRNTGLYNPY